MSAWAVVIVAGVATYLTRLSFIGLIPHEALPGWFARTLRFVPAAVLTAIIVPELLIREGQVHVGLDNPRLVAGLVAVAVAWKTKSALATIAAGMALLWLLQWAAAR
jgi:branched-subunit amino acid transport protein